MRPELQAYIDSILEVSSSPFWVDQALVSRFLEVNQIREVRNRLVSGLMMSENTGLGQKYFSIPFGGESFDLEELISAFEYVLSPASKVINGAVYTPRNIREQIICRAFEVRIPSQESSYIDWACGCGSFLLSTAEIIHARFPISFSEIFSKCLFGLDIDASSVKRAKIVLTLKAILEGEDEESFDFNICTGDALEFQWPENNGLKTFDYAFGNPPFVCSRKFDEKTRKLLARWETANSGHPDLYLLFFEIGLESLSPDGVLGYITINSFFRSLNGRSARKLFSDGSYSVEIHDFGDKQVFADRSTYTCLCFIHRLGTPGVSYQDGDLDKILTSPHVQIPWKTLDHKRGWNLREFEFLDRIEKTGLPLGDRYRTRNGIATLKNALYIFTPIAETETDFILRNGSDYEIEKGICLDVVNSNKLTRIDDLSEIRQKVIFPYSYEASDSSPSILSEASMREKFPKAFRYLESKRKVLATRDKGNGKYEAWFAYGRRQSLERVKWKLLFPHIAKTTPNFVLSDDPSLLFYNGMAAIADSENQLRFLRILMESQLFWRYISLSSKPYSSGYFSLSRNYIKHFGIPSVSDEQIEAISNISDTIDREVAIQKLYGSAPM